MNYNLYQAEDFAADELFIAYFLKTDAEAVRFWSQWISQHPEKLDEILNAEQILTLLFIRLEEDKYQEEFKNFEGFLDANPAMEQEIAGSNRIRKLTSWASVAAAALVIIMGGSYFYQLSKNEKIEYVNQRSDYGQLTTVILSDGSKVSLNSNSKLSYPRLFTGNKREVTLEGEAYFEVSKDKDHPFVVKSATQEVEVLGTHFNINAYPMESGTKTTLIEGSVRVAGLINHQSRLLVPGQQSTNTSTSLTVETIDTESIISWKEGILEFRNASFETVAQRIKNLYGLDLVNKTGDTNWKYTGKFKKTDYLSIIKSICFAKRINYTMQHQTITFTK